MFPDRFFVVVVVPKHCWILFVLRSKVCVSYDLFCCYCDENSNYCSVRCSAPGGQLLVVVQESTGIVFQGAPAPKFHCTVFPKETVKASEFSLFVSHCISLIFIFMPSIFFFFVMKLRLVFSFHKCQRMNEKWCVSRNELL